MEPSQITAFTDEAERKLRMVRNGVLVSRQEGRPVAIDPVIELARLRNEAVRLDLHTVAAVLETVERETREMFHPERPMSDAEAYTMLDLISHAEAEVVKLRFSQDDQDVQSFVDRSFEAWLGTAADSTAAPKVPAEVIEEEEEDGFEPDAEMLEVFSMEADELLTGIESNLQRLSASPADRDALWEIRRHAHTFKGAAGIIGLKKPSKLAHRIEDLLDQLAGSEIVPNTATLDLIASATVCLRAITGGDNSPGITERTAAVYDSFDKVLEALLNGPPALDVPAPSAEPVPGPAQAAEPAPPSPAAEPAAPRRPIVRVSINRLDNLVRIVRDLVVSRSAVEQRMAGLEAQLEALGRTTRRLQASHAKIENDYEASMLRSYVPSLFSRTGPANFESGESGRGEHFDSLEFDRYTDFHESTRELSEAIQDCFSIGTSLEALKSSLDTVIDDQRRLIEETQDKVMQIRLIRFESLATRLERAGRITCEETGKDAEVVIENPHIELDTDVLDSLVEPLMHLIRNAVVHGIEPPETRRLLGKPQTGRITVRVVDQETHIELKVCDDGRGIDAAALRERAIETKMVRADDKTAVPDLLSLLALPGLTTAEKLTMSAGRGVGMGIVRESVALRGGTLTVETSLQQGTTFTIKVPLAFAVTQALLVRSDGNLAAIPFKTVKRILEITPDDLRQNGSVLEAGSDLYPVSRLTDSFPRKRPTGAAPGNALLIGSDDVRFALVVDEILRLEEIAIKPLGKPLDRIPGLLGSAVLGNGEVAPVVDVAHFVAAECVNFPEAAPLPPAPVETRTVVLIVDDSPSVRHMTSKVITAAGWTVLTAKDGLEALELLHAGQLPDVILSDVEMPRMDGYGLAAAVRSEEKFRNIPLVFITSRAGEKHREKAEELGVTEYLTKPFIDTELTGTVERLTAATVTI